MSNLTIRTFLPDDLPAMTEVIKRALAVCPDRDMPDMGFCFHPSFEQGKNILCALEGDRLVGYIQIFPWGVPEAAGQPRRIMLDLKADPEYPAASDVKDLLYKHSMDRVREIASETPECTVEAYACYFTAGAASLDFFSEKGFMPEPDLILLECDLTTITPPPEQLEGLVIRQWRMERDDELLAWLQVHNEALPMNIENLTSLRAYLYMPTLTTYTAFDGDTIAGSVMIFHNSAGGSELVGKVERVFVSPTYRRRGIARTLLRHALHHFKLHGLTTATLDTSTENHNALGLYTGVGFRVVREIGTVCMRIE